MISDEHLFYIYFGIGMLLIGVQLAFFLIFKKDGLKFSDFDIFHNEYGAWWFLSKPGLAFKDRFKWIAVSPSYIGAFMTLGMLIYQIFCH